MKKAAFWFFAALSAMVNAMPRGLRYLFSDFLAVMMHHVIGYRKQVVRKNLKNSFPEKTDHELRSIERKFYRNLADFFVESLQLLTMKADQLKNSIELINKAVLDSALGRGRKVFVAIGHSGNWEWFGVYLSMLYPGKTASFYKEQRNKLFDALIYRMRTRLGGIKMLESKSAYRTLAGKQNPIELVIVPGDQTPGGKPTDHWTSFMHQDTPFFNGLEKMATSLGYDVLFADLQRIGRGKYQARFEPLFTGGDLEMQGTITEAYARKLEHALNQRPDNWLWSHRRWKHKRNIS